MLEQSVVCWNDLSWIRRVWKGPLVIKGIQSRADARIAVTRAIEILRSDILRTMKLLGCSAVNLLDRSYLETEESGRRLDIVERVGAL